MICDVFVLLNGSGRRTRRLLLSIGGYIIDWQEELRKKRWVMRMLLGRGFEGVLPVNGYKQRNKESG
jgi:hypothetical protein